MNIPAQQKLLLIFKPQAKDSYAEKWVMTMFAALGARRQPGKGDFTSLGGDKAALMDLSDYTMHRVLTAPDAETARSLEKLSDPIHQISLRLETRLSLEERRQFGDNFTHRIVVGREGDLKNMANEGIELTKVDPSLIPPPAPVRTTQAEPARYSASQGRSDLIVVFRGEVDLKIQNDVISSIYAPEGAIRAASRPTVEFFASTSDRPAEAVYSLHSTEKSLELARRFGEAGNQNPGYRTNFTEATHPKDFPGFKRGSNFFVAPRLLEIDRV